MTKKRFFIRGLEAFANPMSLIVQTKMSVLLRNVADEAWDRGDKNLAEELHAMVRHEAAKEN